MLLRKIDYSQLDLLKIYFHAKDVTSRYFPQP